MAPVLKDGIYEIRFVPRFILPPIIGGSYATGGAINDPIRAEALSPEVQGNQIWEITSVPDGGNIFTITHRRFINTHGGHGPVLPGFGLSQVADKETVILSVSIEEFRIQLTQDATDEHLIANIIVPREQQVDTVQAITEENQLLYVETSIVGRPVTLPRWEFIPVTS